MKKLLVVIMCFTLLYACSSNEDDVIVQENNITKADLESFKNELADNLNNLGDRLRARESNFGDVGMVRAIVEDQGSYCNMNVIEFDRVTNRLNTDSRTKIEIAPQKCVTSYQASIISEIDQKINEADTPAEYNNLMEELKEKILNDDVTEIEKESLLLLITSQQTAIEFIDNNQDLFKAQAIGVKSGGWWKSWGKCASGIIGGVVTGATTLGLAGAAIGTVVLPVIGTVSAGVVGVVGGAIGGAFTGAMVSCDGGGNDTHQISPVEDSNILICSSCNNSNILSELCIEEDRKINGPLLDWDGN